MFSFFILVTNLDSQASSSKSPSLLEKANMLMLSRKATEKDRTLKTQMLLSASQNEKEKNGELIQSDNGVFSDKRADFNISKKLS